MEPKATPQPQKPGAVLKDPRSYNIDDYHKLSDDELDNVLSQQQSSSKSTGSSFGGVGNGNHLTGISINQAEQGRAQAFKAEDQGALENIANRAMRFIPNIALGIAEQAGYLADGENYVGLAKAGTDFDNWFSKGARDLKAGMDENFLGMGINTENYRKDNETFSPGDSAWWIDNIADLTESIAEFYATGAGIGKGLGTLAAKGAGRLAKMGAKGLAEAIKTSTQAAEFVKASEAGAGLVNKAVTGAQFASSSLLSFTGGVMQAQESYRNLYESAIKDGVSEDKAKEAAANGAASIVRWTTGVGSMLNITSLGPIFRPFKQEVEFAELSAERLGAKAVAGGAAAAEAGSADNLLAQLKLLKSNGPALEKTEGIWKRMFKPEGLGWEMGQEAVEEFSENAAQVYGENRGRKQVGNLKEDDYFSKEALLAASLGAVGGGIGKGFMAGIDKINGNESRGVEDFARAVDIRIDSLEKYKKSTEDYQEALKSKDPLKALAARNELFSHHVHHAIQNKTDDLLKASYQDVLDLSPEDAEKAGYDVDEMSPGYYKKTAKSGMVHLEKSKQIYDAVLQDNTIPGEAKGHLIGALVAMETVQQQDKDLTGQIDNLYAGSGLEPHVLTAKRLTNEIEVLEQDQRKIEESRKGASTAANVLLDRRILPLQKQIAAAKKKLEDHTSTLTPEQQKDVANLPMIPADAQIKRMESERGVARAQNEQFTTRAKELYDPKKREARLAKDKEAGELRDKSNRIHGAINAMVPTFQKADASVNEMQAHIDQAKMLAVETAGTEYDAEVQKRISGMETVRDLHKKAAQAKNEERAAEEGRAHAYARLKEVADPIAQERHDAASAAFDANVAYNAHPNRTQPVDQLLSRQRASKIRGPQAAMMGKEDGLVDLDENGSPVFVATDGTVIPLNAKKLLSAQGVKVYHNVVPPTVVNIRTVDGAKLGIELAGEMYTIATINPSDSLYFDDDGALLEVNLLNSKGEKVTITDEQILYDIADPIMLYQSLMDIWLEDASTMTDNGEIAYAMELGNRTYYVVYDHRDPLNSKILGKGGTELLVGMKSYRGKDGELTRKGIILDALVDSFHKDVLARVIDRAWKRVEDNRKVDVEANEYWDAQQASDQEGLALDLYYEGENTNAATASSYVSPADPQLPGEASPAIPQGPATQAGSNDPQAAGAAPATGTPEVQPITAQQEAVAITGSAASDTSIDAGLYFEDQTVAGGKVKIGLKSKEAGTAFKAALDAHFAAILPGAKVHTVKDVNGGIDLTIDYKGVTYPIQEHMFVSYTGGRARFQTLVFTLLANSIIEDAALRAAGQSTPYEEGQAFDVFHEGKKYEVRKARNGGYEYINNGEWKGLPIYEAFYPAVTAAESKLLATIPAVPVVNGVTVQPSALTKGTDGRWHFTANNGESYTLDNKQGADTLTIRALNDKTRQFDAEITFFKNSQGLWQEQSGSRSINPNRKKLGLEEAIIQARTAANSLLSTSTASTGVGRIDLKPNSLQDATYATSSQNKELISGKQTSKTPTARTPLVISSDGFMFMNPGLDVNGLVEGDGLRSIGEFFEYAASTTKVITGLRVTKPARLIKNIAGNWELIEKGVLASDFADGTASDDVRVTTKPAEVRGDAVAAQVNAAKAAALPAPTPGAGFNLGIQPPSLSPAEQAELAGVREGSGERDQEEKAEKKKLEKLQNQGSGEGDEEYKAQRRADKKEQERADGPPDDIEEQQEAKRLARAEDPEYQAAKGAERGAARAEKRFNAKKTAGKTKATDKKGLRATDTGFGFNQYSGSTEIKLDNGYPIVWQPENNIVLGALSNPELGIGTKVVFELGNNTWWQGEKAKHKPEDYWKVQPIFVVIGGNRVAMLQNEYSNRRAVHQALLEGRVVGATIESKNASNVINLKLNGKPHLRPVTVMNGKWEDGKFVNSPVVLTVAVGMNPDGDFVPNGMGYAGLDVDGLAKSNPEIAANMMNLNPKVGSQLNGDGHVYAMIQAPDGKYVPHKLSTANLTESAIDKIVALLEIGDVDEIGKLVFTKTPDDQADAATKKHFSIVKGKDGTFLAYYSKAAGGVVKVDLDDIQSAMASGKDVINVSGTKLVNDGKHTWLLRNGITHQVDILADLRNILAQKKFHVDAALLNTPRRFPSPLTGEKYETYLDYLASGTEVEGGILKTDAFGGYPDGTAAGAFHYNIGLGFDNIRIGEKEVLPTTSTATSVKTTLSRREVASGRHIEVNINDNQVEFYVQRNGDIHIHRGDGMFVRAVGEELQNLQRIDEESNDTYNPRDDDDDNDEGNGADGDSDLNGYSDELFDAFLKRKESQATTVAITDSLFSESEIAAKSTPQSGVAGKQVIDLASLDEEDEEPFRLGDDTGEARDMTAAKQWLTDRGFPPEVHAYMRVIGGKVAHGSFKAGLVKLWTGSEIGTEYHEGFHAVLRSFVSPAEMARLLDEGRARYGMEGSTDLEVEERLAEDFRHFVMTGVRPKDVRVRNLFQKIWDAIKNYLSNLLSIDTLFDQIEGNTFDRSVKNNLTKSKTEVFSAKGNFSSKTQKEIVDSIATYVINNTKLSAQEKMDDVRLEYTRRMFISTTTNTYPNTAVGDLLYEEFVKGKSVMTLPDGYVASDKFVNMRKVVMAWYDEREGGEYNNLLEKGWQSLAKERMKHFGFRISGELAEEMDEKQPEEKIYNQASVEKSVKDTLASAIKSFLMQVPQLDKNGKPVTNIIDNPVFVPFDTVVFPELLRLLANSRDINEMAARIEFEAQTTPWMGHILNGLQNGTSKTQAHIFRNQFFPAMAMIEKSFSYLQMEGSGDKDDSSVRMLVVDSNSANINNATKKSWQTNAYLEEDMGGSGLFIKQEDGSYQVDSIKAQQVSSLINSLQVVTPTTDLTSETGKKALENYANLLRLMGATVEVSQLETWLADGDTPPKSKKKLVGSALLHYVVKDGIKREDGTPGLSVIAKTLLGNGDPYDSDSNVVKRLSQGISKYIKSPTLSFLGGAGKSIYPINLPTALDELMNSYVRDEGFSTRLLTDGFFFPDRKDGKVDQEGEYSSPFAYALISKKSDFKKVFGKETLDVLKDQTKGQTENTAYGDLYYGGELKTRLGYFLAPGENTMRIASHTLADRGQMVFLRVPRISYDHKNHKYAHTVEQMLLGYVLQDITRAVRVKKEVDEANRTGDTSQLLANYHYNKDFNKEGRAMQFTQWDFLQTLEDPKYPGSNAAKELMKKAHASDGPDAFMASWEELTELREATYQYIKDYLKSQEKVLKDALTKYNVPASSLDLTRFEGNLDNMIREFVLADTITRNETSKLFSGDSAQFGSHEKFSKRWGILESPGYKSAEEDGNTNGYGDMKSYNMALMNDFKTTQQAYTYIEEMKDWLDPSTLADYAEGANKSDAIGVTTLRKHRGKMMGRGTWTYAHAQAYANYYGRKDEMYPKIKPDPDFKGQFSFKTKEGKIESPPLTPIKTLTDALIMKDGVLVRIVIKHSTFPLLKGITQRMPGLDSVREHMEKSRGKNQIDVVNMDSAAKVALWGNISMEEDKDGRFTNLDKLTPINIPMRFERTPQIVPDTQSKEPLWGSQAKKMLTTDIVADGTYVLANGKTLSGTALFQNYNTAGSLLMQQSMKELYEKLDYTPKSMSDPTARKSFMVKVQQSLLSGVEGKDLSDNYFKGLALTNVNGLADFRVPLSLPPVQRKFEGMLLGSFKKEVMQQRLHGSSMVQIPEIGGHMLQSKSDELEHGALKFVTKGTQEIINSKGQKETVAIVDHAEVAIPFDLALKMGLTPGPDGEFNLQEKDGNGKLLVDPELLTMVGYRIPTQGKNSMLPMKVVRVLPPNVKAIMVPGFITKQMGSDFDVDKLFLMKKNYEEVYMLNGKPFNKIADLQKSLAKVEYILSNREIKKLLGGNKDSFDELEGSNPTMGDKDTFMKNWDNLVAKMDKKLAGVKPTIKKVTYDADVKKNRAHEDYRERLENYIIDITEAVLRSPLHVNEMIKSVDSPTLPNLAKEAQKIDAIKALKAKGIIDPTPAQIKQENTLSAQGIMTEVVLSQRNKAGGAGIGMYATAGTGHALGQHMKKDGRKLELAPDYAVRIGKEVLTDMTATKGPISLGAAHIATGYNERLNASVDNANTPVMSFINDNSFTYPVINLLIRAGVGNEIATYVCRQPVILELTEYFLNEEMTPDRLVEAANEIGKKYSSSYDAASAKTTTSMSVESLKSGMLTGGNEVDILNNFVLFHKAGRMLAKVNRIANSDRVDDMSTLSGIEEYQDVQAEITSPTRNKMIRNASIVTEIGSPAHGLVAEYQKTIAEAERFASNFFPYTAPGMKAVKSTLRTALNKTNLTREMLDAVNQDAALYLFTRPNSPFRDLLTNVDDSVRDLMNGPNALVKRLKAIQTTHKNLDNAGKLSANALLSRLAPSDTNKKSGNQVNTLQLSSSYSMSQYEVNEIIDAFLRLATSKDPNDRLFADDLVKYTLLSNGFTPSKDSLLEYIPMEYWTDQKFYANGTTMADFFRQNPPNLSIEEQQDFTRKFIKNNYHIKGMLPTVYKAKPEFNPASGRMEITLPNSRKYFNSDMADQGVTGGWVESVVTYNAKTKQPVLYEFTGTNAAGKGVYAQTETYGVPYQLKNYGDKALNTKTEVVTSTGTPASTTIDISSSAKQSPFFAKDVVKFKLATKLISRGSAQSSSNAYAKAAGDKANTGTYTADDIVGISAEGLRGNRITPDFKEIQRAIDANVRGFITDDVAARTRDHNVGEREVAKYLTSKGYVDVKGNGRWKSDSAVSSVSNPKAQEVLNQETGNTYHPNRPGC